MLNRTLEPEVMDTPAEAQAYDSMDHASVNQTFVDDLLSVWIPPELADSDDGEQFIGVLDLGTGTARIPIELCNRVESVRVMAADAAVSMLEVARLNVEVAGIVDRIQLEQIDAKVLPYPDDQFDAVISNTLIHHLADPLPIVQEALRVVKPTGAIFFRDLLRPPDDAAVKRLVQRYAGSETDEQRKLLDDSLRAALGLEETRDLIRAIKYDPKAVRTTSDRHWTWFTRKRER